MIPEGEAFCLLTTILTEYIAMSKPFDDAISLIDPGDTWSIDA